MEELLAFANFVDYFTDHFGKSLICCRFSVTKLCTKICELSADNDKLLVFYLHHSLNELSMEFCHFLQDSEIEAAFICSDKLILYCWDIKEDAFKPKLIEVFKTSINDAATPYIEQNKSAIFLIKSENNVPTILEIYDDPLELVELRNRLLFLNMTNALSFQKYMAKLLGNREYDSFESNEHKSLKDKIGFALYGPATESTGTEYMTDYQKAIDKLYLQILEENNAVSKWNGRVVIGFVFVYAEALPEDKKEKAKKCKKQGELYNPDKDFVRYPVFILRKCKNHDSSKACRIIIDHDGRVYKTWDDYLKDNELPRCKMVYPKDGRYYPSKDVQFSMKDSPACNPIKKVLKVTDIVAGVSGFVAGGASIAATSATMVAAVPFLAAAAPLAAAVGIGSGIYAVGRSTSSLVDKANHKQKNIGMGGATRTQGTGRGTKCILYGMTGVGLTLNHIIIGNDIYGACHVKKLSLLLIAQISTSILFFGHSLYSFKAVGDIIENSQMKAFSQNSFRSNIHRHIVFIFNKLLEESIQIRGESQGKSSVISLMRNMENADDVIATLIHPNKMLNKQGIRFSAEGRQILLNGAPVKMDFGTMSKARQTTHLNKMPPRPENLTPDAKITITQNVEGWLERINMGWEIANRPSNHLTVQRLVDEIFSAFDRFVRVYIMDISNRFFNKVDIYILRRFRVLIPEPIVELMKWIVDQLMDNTAFKKILEHGHFSSEEIDVIINTLYEELKTQYVIYEYEAAKSNERKERRRCKNKIQKKQNCSSCGGYYYI